MATKKNKERKFTLAEVDALEAASFVNGMAEAYTVLITQLDKFQNSVGDVWALYYLGDVSDKHTQSVVSELKVVDKAITHLKDVLEGAYFDALDEHKNIAEEEFARALADEEFTRAWREDIASSKEEWPA